LLSSSFHRFLFFVQSKIVSGTKHKRQQMSVAHEESYTKVIAFNKDDYIGNNSSSAQKQYEAREIN